MLQQTRTYGSFRFSDSPYNMHFAALSGRKQSLVSYNQYYGLTPSLPPQHCAHTLTLPYNVRYTPPLPCGTFLHTLFTSLLDSASPHQNLYPTLSGSTTLPFGAFERESYYPCVLHFHPHPPFPTHEHPSPPHPPLLSRARPLKVIPWASSTPTPSTQSYATPSREGRADRR
jgi:hypothetical protein